MHTYKNYGPMNIITKCYFQQFEIWGKKAHRHKLNAIQAISRTFNITGLSLRLICQGAQTHTILFLSELYKWFPPKHNHGHV
uniref:Uncharacterized protein n=1 Tax=Anguilla anguilla TaxID=7936 RepID=A0A0E9X5F0_ANGAN